jgi:PAS domain S-box-containing protein
MASATYASTRPAPTTDVCVVLDNMPVLAWSSPADGSIDFVNQRWREYTGLSAEASRGPGWRTAVHPDDLPGLLRKWEAQPEVSHAGEYEARLRRSDGVYRWFSIRREPLRDQAGAPLRWCGTAADIENRKQAETLHAAEQRTLEMVADGASLRKILDQLCNSIDARVEPSITTVLLMDADGKRLKQEIRLTFARFSRLYP